ncbi:hypothetical protein GCM10022278_02250 [Allohahella marinimesophila]|uniref:HTH araC/xylS-type domain-containing protein n=2 Tax=Allohahella marinimesophila TaxID=1054972 RepID=A0ABP7NGK1_9GAMM
MSEMITYKVPLVSSRYLRKFVSFMQSKGVSQEALLNNTGIGLATIDDADAFLPVSQIVKMLENAQWLATDERAGFQFGQKLDLIAHGLFGYVLLSRESNAKLVEMVVQHLRVCLPLIDMECTVTGTQAKIRLKDNWNTGTARPFLTKVYLGSIYSIASQVSHAASFEFDYDSALGEADWQALAPDSSWQFNGQHNQITLSLVGRKPQDDNTRVAYSLAREKHIENDGESAVADDAECGSPESREIAAQAREQILKQPGKATLERTAKQLGMSSRYLRQHLAAAGTSFRKMRQDIRHSYADLYLIDTPLSLMDIALKLGFSDQASFTKAYRSWTGNTPGDVRRRGRDATARDEAE